VNVEVRLGGGVKESKKVERRSGSSKKKRNR
jgi:hypothetical protein